MGSAFKTEYALDASALLAVMLQEPGHEQVRAVIDRAFMHAVNVAEAVGKLAREGVPAAEAARMITELNLDIDEELSMEQAAAVGDLLARSRRQGLGLGDCVCLTVAAWAGGIAVTADRRWQELDGQQAGAGEIRVRVIR